MTSAATEAATPPSTLAERRTNLAERRQALSEQREARQGGMPIGDAGTDPGTGTGMSRKIGPLPVWGWLILGAGGLALAWYIYKSRQSSSSSSTTTSGTCIDTNGNSVPCDQVDYGGEIATLQSEIQALQGGQQPTQPANIGNNPSNPVPKVTGMTVSQAMSTLNNAGFQTGTGGKPFSGGSLPSGWTPTKKVSSQSPGPGTRVNYGSSYWPANTSEPFVDIS